MADSAFFANEMGQIHISDKIIRQAIEPELYVENKFEPDSTARGSINISYQEGRVQTITLEMAVSYGMVIQNEAQQLQESVRRSVETITGLSVGEVVVTVKRLFEPMEAPAPRKVESE